MNYIFVRGKHVYRGAFSLSWRLLACVLFFCILGCITTSAFSARAEDNARDIGEAHDLTMSADQIRSYFYNQKWQMLIQSGIVKNVCTINPHDGVYEYGNKTEKYYSSLVLVHKDLGSFWCDHEGFWHDANGYYVVASVDFNTGEIFDCSKGLACVHDCGCDPGIVDFYTCWES